MFVATANLPNSFFPCGYIFVVLCLSTHFTTDPSLHFGFSFCAFNFLRSVLCGLQLTSWLKISVPNVFSQKNILSVLVFDLKLLNLEGQWLHLINFIRNLMSFS